MIEEKNIFLTGATGNLGAQLLKLLLLDKTQKAKLFLLVRAESESHAQKRIDKVLQWILPKKSKNILNKKIQILVGDVSLDHFGLSAQEYNLLIEKVDVIYHSAALTRFQDPEDKLKACNIEGTQRILDLIVKSRNSINLHYISSVFIAGNFNGKFDENHFDLGQDFNNPYEESKFKAERIIREFQKKNSNVKIYRPSIIVGDYNSGAIIEFQMFYHPVYLLSQEIFDEFPINKNTFLNIIPADIAASMIINLAKNPSCDNNFVYHIVSHKPFSVLDVIECASKYFKFVKPKIGKNIKFKNPVFEKLYKEPIKPLLNYLQFKADLGCKITMKRLDDLNFILPIYDEQFLERLFKYANQLRYIKIRK